MRRTLVLAATAALVVGLQAAPALGQSYIDGLLIEKTVAGDAPGDAEYEFTLSCAKDGRQLTLDSDGRTELSFALRDGERTQAVETIEPGAECVVEESLPDGVEEHDLLTTWSVSAEPASVSYDVEQDNRRVTVTVPEDERARIAVTALNDFGETEVLGGGELIVSKRVSGDAEGPWDFRVECPGSVRDTVTLGDGESATFPVTRFPDMACTVTELGAGDYDVTHTLDGGDAVEGAQATFEFDDESVPTDVLLVRELDFTNTPAPDEPDPDDPDDPTHEDETAVLADTGFELSWGLVLAAGLLLPGTGLLVYARRRDRKGA